MTSEYVGLPVHGYTPQSASNVDIVNRSKEAEERLLRFIDSLDGIGDPRWLAIARTHVQEGFMALNRAIFKPTRIKLPEDGEPGNEAPSPPDAA
jgi:hypothetical protein